MPRYLVSRHEPGRPCSAPPAGATRVDSRRRLSGRVGRSEAAVAARILGGRTEAGIAVLVERHHLAVLPAGVAREADVAHVPLVTVRSGIGIGRAEAAVGAGIDRLLGGLVTVHVDGLD